MFDIKEGVSEPCYCYMINDLTLSGVSKDQKVHRRFDDSSELIISGQVSLPSHLYSRVSVVIMYKQIYSAPLSELIIKERQKTLRETNLHKYNA